MKKIIFLSLLAIPFLAKSQSKEQLKDSIINNCYHSSIGWIIKPGDTIRLGIGSMPNRKYAFIYRSPVNALKLISESTGGSSGYHETSDDGYSKVYLGSDQARQIIIKGFFVNGTKRGGYTLMAKVGLGQMANYWMEVENAIQADEILAPGQLALKQKNNNVETSATTVVQQSDDNLDKLKKLKSLLDAGAITQAEYDAQKKKLLGE